MKFAFSFKTLLFRAEELHDSKNMPCEVGAASDQAQIQDMGEKGVEGSEVPKVSCGEVPPDVRVW